LRISVDSNIDIAECRRYKHEPQMYNNTTVTSSLTKRGNIKNTLPITENTSCINKNEFILTFFPIDFQALKTELIIRNMQPIANSTTPLISLLFASATEGRNMTDPSRKKDEAQGGEIIFKKSAKVDDSTCPRKSIRAVADTQHTLPVTKQVAPQNMHDTPLTHFKSG
jgi:hypothetical protein